MVFCPGVAEGGGEVEPDGELLGLDVDDGVDEGLDVLPPPVVGWPVADKPSNEPTGG